MGTKDIYGCLYERNNRIWFYDWNCCSYWAFMCLWRAKVVLIETTYDDPAWVIASGEPILANEVLNKWWDDVHSPKLLREPACNPCITYWKFAGDHFQRWQGRISNLHGWRQNGLYIRHNADFKISLDEDFEQDNLVASNASDGVLYTTDYWQQCLPNGAPAGLQYLAGPDEERIYNAHRLGELYLQLDNPDFDPEAEPPVKLRVWHRYCQQYFDICQEEHEGENRLKITIPDDCCPPRNEEFYRIWIDGKNYVFCSDKEPDQMEYKAIGLDMCGFEVDVDEYDFLWEVETTDWAEDGPEGGPVGNISAVAGTNKAIFYPNQNLTCWQWVRGKIKVTATKGGNSWSATRWVSVRYCDPENECEIPPEEGEPPGEDWEWGWCWTWLDGQWRKGWGWRRRPGTPGPRPDPPDPEDPDPDDCDQEPAPWCVINCGGSPPDDPDPDPPDEPDPDPDLPPEPPDTPPPPDDDDPPDEPPWIEPPDDPEDPPDDPTIPPPGGPGMPPPPGPQPPEDEIGPPIEPPIEAGDDCQYCKEEFEDEEIGVGDGVQDTFCPECDEGELDNIHNIRLDDTLQYKGSDPEWDDYYIEDNCIVFHEPPDEGQVVTANYDCKYITPKFVRVIMTGTVVDKQCEITTHTYTLTGDINFDAVLEQDENSPCKWGGVLEDYTGYGGVITSTSYRKHDGHTITSLHYVSYIEVTRRENDVKVALTISDENGNFYGTSIGPELTLDENAECVEADADFDMDNADENLLDTFYCTEDETYRHITGINIKTEAANE